MHWYHQTDSAMQNYASSSHCTHCSPAAMRVVLLWCIGGSGEGGTGCSGVALANTQQGVRCRQAQAPVQACTVRAGNSIAARKR